MARGWLLLGIAALLACGDQADELGPIPDVSADASSDASATNPEASSEIDAGDAGLIPPPEAGVFRTVFADDFEDGDLKGAWEVLNVCSGCSATVDNGAFVAKTKSIVAQETAFAHLRTTVPGTPSRIRLSFSATFPSVTLAQGSIAVATVDVSSNHFFSLYFRDTDTNDPAPTLEETSAAGTKRHFLANLPPPANKTRVVVDIDLGAGVANVAWDATVALGNEAIDKTPAAAAPTIRVGLMYAFGPMPAFEATFDDVLLEYY